MLRGDTYQVTRYQIGGFLRVDVQGLCWGLSIQFVLKFQLSFWLFVDYFALAQDVLA